MCPLTNLARRTSGSRRQRAEPLPREASAAGAHNEGRRTRLSRSLSAHVAFPSAVGSAAGHLDPKASASSANSHLGEAASARPKSPGASHASPVSSIPRCEPALIPARDLATSVGLPRSRRAAGDSPSSKPRLFSSVAFLANTGTRARTQDRRPGWSSSRISRGVPLRHRFLLGREGVTRVVSPTLWQLSIGGAGAGVANTTLADVCPCDCGSSTRSRRVVGRSLVARVTG